MASMNSRLEEQWHSEKLVSSEGESVDHQAYNMDDLDISSLTQLDNSAVATKDAAIQALQSIIHAHFEKTMEKKEQVDVQKKKLWQLFGYFFIFLAILFVGVIQAPRMHCHHSWTAISVFFLASIMFYVAMSQTLRVINGFKYQRRCHKLTLGLANDKLRSVKETPSNSIPETDFEVTYQEPTEDYVNKFKRKWLLFTLFLATLFGVTVSSFATVLCN